MPFVTLISIIHEHREDLLVDHGQDGLTLHARSKTVFEASVIVPDGASEGLANLCLDPAIIASREALLKKLASL